MNTQFFVINLKGSDERLAKAQSNFEQIGVKLNRVDAFDGRKLNVNTHAEYDDQKCRRYMGRSMTGGEIGCYISHQRAARQFLDSGATFGVVFEDDFEWTDGGDTILPELLDLLETGEIENWHVMNIGAQKNKISSPMTTLSDRSITRSHYFPILATGLIWNRQGAEEFLKQSKCIYMPLDNLLRHYLTRSDLGLTIWPSLVQAAGFDSDIDALTNRTDKTGRAWNYALAKQKRLWIDKLIASKNKFFGPNK